jgi:hypothetical protein
MVTKVTPTAICRLSRYILLRRCRKALRHTIAPQRRASNAQLRRNNAYLMYNLGTYALVLDVVNLEVTFELMNL